MRHTALVAPLASRYGPALLMPLLVAGLAAQSVFNATELARKVAPSVVLIQGKDQDGSTITGTGFVVSSDGKIVTCLHVIEWLESGTIQLASGQMFNSFSVRAFDERHDLAVVQIPDLNFPSVELGDSSSEIQSGESVLVLGNAEGFVRTVTSGIVSAVREMDGVKLIQTDAAANPGSSGGPLINVRGQVIGVMDKKYQGENLNFAMPTSYIPGMLSNLQKPFTLAELRTRLDHSSADGCRDPQVVEWSHGTPFVFKHCGGLEIVVGITPLQSNPLTYVVAVTNRSHESLDVDWHQWALFPHNGTPDPGVDPLTVKSRLENRAAWSSFFGGLSESLNKRRATIQGPGGTSTITIQPTRGEVQAAAQAAGAPLRLEAQYLYENAFLLTTLRPGARVAGLIIFHKVKTGGGTLQLSLPGLPLVSFPVATP